MMYSSVLYLIRGLPGSGKSTFADKLEHLYDSISIEVVSISADQFMGDEFDLKRLGACHRRCQEAVRSFMDHDNIDGRACIVHNTLTTEKEMKPYLDLAEEFNWAVQSIVLENRHGNTSVHGVPDKTIEKMKNRFSVKL